MADWIKIRHSLVRSPKMSMLGREIHANRYTAIGVAVAWLVWLDEQTEEGETGLSAAEVDDMLGFRGLAAGLVRIGWAEVGGDGLLVATEFDKHNGASAKSRAETAIRVAKCKIRKSNAESVTEVTEEALPKAYLDKKREEINKEGVSKATVSSGRESVALPPPPDGFGGWVGKVAQAHPSCRKSNVLAPDVEAAARAAFARCPAAAEQAEMLRAYLGDRMQEDSYRHPFYRPTGQAKFFENLEDVLAHAERWARETGWKPAGARCKKKVEKHTADEPIATPEQREEFLRGLREDAEKGGKI